jgi:peptidoglycan hydrolase-like protein with peptidoglycan-binding domain
MVKPQSRRSHLVWRVGIAGRVHKVFARTVILVTVLVSFAGVSLAGGAGAAVLGQAASTLPASTSTGPATPSSTAPTGQAATSVPASQSTSAPTTGAGTSTSQVGSPSSLVPTTAIATTEVPTTIFKPGPVLRVGSKGDAVMEMERRLDLLKYEVGKVDGRYDWQTWQGVMAFQKFNRLSRSGKFDVDTQTALSTATMPGGLIPNGGLPRVEVDLTRQVMLYFDQYGLHRVVAISSGNNKSYCDYSKKSQKTVCGKATTPRGNFRVQRKILGDRESDLGHLYSPVYFNGGFAVHGSPSVPAGPASHGCVRVTNYTADWFHDKTDIGTPVYLFD